MSEPQRRSPLRRALRVMTPRPVLAWIDEQRVYHHTLRSPDRVVLTERIFPAFGAQQDVLWIGCRRYTKHYPVLLEAEGGTCWTIDIDPAAARWGHPERHLVADVIQAGELFPPGAFDVVYCNGIFGFGINDAGGRARAFEALHAVLRPAGWLLVGWHAQTADPLAGTLPPGFERAAPEGLPSRWPVEGVHVYDFLRRL